MQAHAFMNTIRYIVLVDLRLLSEFTEKLPGKCSYPPHTHTLQKVYLEVCSTRWPMGGRSPWPQCQGKDQKSDTKVKKNIMSFRTVTGCSSE